MTLWIASGEPLPAVLVSRFAARLPRALLVNMYGASELANDVTWIELTPPVAEPVPIGWTVANMQCYVLDRHMRPVPQGAVGELYVGGAGLNRGYLERPHLTAERFVPNPFATLTPAAAAAPPLPRTGEGAGGEGVRLYKTGDLARYRADGALVFMGRSDQQVKLRGYRIELSEIAAALEQHPAVRAVVVVARAEQDQPGEKRLVAYVVQGSGSEDKETRKQGDKENPNVSLSALRPLTPDPRSLVSELRTFLKTRLPDYMLPSAFIMLDALPLTPSGKVDRRALPAPDQLPAEQEDAYVAPRTPTEEVIASSWAEVLGRTRVGIYDNFFALGGHSLLVTRAISRMRDAFQVELPLRNLFETPTVAALAERIDAIRQEAQGLTAPPIQPIPRDGDIPLSFAQQRLWFLDQLAPGSAAYTLPAAIQVHGALDVAALRRSLSAIMRRHEALRTTFVTNAGRPVQVIAAAQPHALALVDLSAQPAAERSEHARRLAQAEAARPFDLARGPLIRATLIRLSSADHLLLITTHHIIFDGSHEIFFRELAALYSADVRGVPPDLPNLPVQYADFAHWQRNWFTGAVRDAQLNYWRAQLGQQIAPLDLPTDRPRPPLPSFRGAQHSLNLSTELTAALNRLSQQAGVTLFMTLLAGLQSLLVRYTALRPIAIGTPIATRSRAVTEHLIGCFVNTLVMSADLSDNPPFQTLLQRVREVALGAYTHQDLPFEMLVEALQTARDLSRNPLYQVMFALQHAPFQGLTFPNLSLSPLELDTGSARFDLLLALTEHEHGLAGSIEYATDLFDAATIARLAGHLATMLEGIVHDPAQRLADLPLLTLAERQQMLDEWNATAAPYVHDVCIHQLFEAQAAHTPDAIALVGDAGQVSYRALNTQANQVAWQLAALGVGPGTSVAVVLDRSLELIPALLGVLKAGGVYVPLEPSFPSARIQWIMATLKIAHIVTQAAQLARGIELYAEVPTLAHVLCLDSAPPALARPADGPQLWTRAALNRQPGTNPPSRTSADNLAYIIFTSGSTGTPKGVMVCHQPVINLIEWLNRTCAISATDQVLFVTSVCFDLSVYDIFGVLAAGATIRLVADAAVRDPQRLLALMEHEPITLWDSAPTALQQLAPFFPEPGPARAASRLRLVLLSGDWIPVRLPDQLRRSFPNAAVLSLGGATEATVWSNYYAVGAVPPEWTSIPYGRPIQNARYYILDDRMQPVPVGVVGELYIGGACLCLGYASAPALTAERFVPNPFADFGFWILDFGLGLIQNPKSKIQNGDRLYKTGDQARFWPDGTIIFLGRRDQQVKLRGYRIELGEIESVLHQHQRVREAVVVAREDGPGGKRLVAYIVPSADDRPSTIDDEMLPERLTIVHRPSSIVQELRTFLATRLPDYMLPAAFMILDALPMTPNGKLDRKALPAPDQIRPMLNELFVPPRTSAEQALADIWTQVLGLDRVGVHDNFFEIGGDSIMSIQIVARAHEAGLPLRAQHLFQYQTIAELSTLADSVAAVPATLSADTLDSADFALAQLDQDELDAAIGQITFEEGSSL